MRLAYSNFVRRHIRSCNEEQEGKSASNQQRTEEGFELMIEI